LIVLKPSPDNSENPFLRFFNRKKIVMNSRKKLLI
jgi:hypothetical protein